MRLLALRDLTDLYQLESQRFDLREYPVQRSLIGSMPRNSVQLPLGSA